MDMDVKPITITDQFKLEPVVFSILHLKMCGLVTARMLPMAPSNKMNLMMKFSQVFELQMTNKKRKTRALSICSVVIVLKVVGILALVCLLLFHAERFGDDLVDGDTSEVVQFTLSGNGTGNLPGNLVGRLTASNQLPAKLENRSIGLGGPENPFTSETVSDVFECLCVLHGGMLYYCFDGVKQISNRILSECVQ